MNPYNKRSYTLQPRVAFDPTNREHLLDYAEFLKYNNWIRGCKYLLEDPYSDIPTMIAAKVGEHFMRQFVDMV